MPTSSPMPRRRLRPITTDSPGGRTIGFRPLPSTGRKWYVIASKFRCPGRPPRPPSALFSGPYRGTSSAALDIPSLDYCAASRVVIIASKSADVRRLAKTLYSSLSCSALGSDSLLASVRLTNLESNDGHTESRHPCGKKIRGFYRGTLIDAVLTLTGEYLTSCGRISARGSTLLFQVYRSSDPGTHPASNASLRANCDAFARCLEYANTLLE